MTPLGDWSTAFRAFSRPARLLLLASLLAWSGFGINQVLFNLYLVEGGFGEAFVGRAIAVGALGMALAALPAGALADRWGRRRCLALGAGLEGVGMLLRAVVLAPAAIYAGGFVAGVGQAFIAIVAAPFMTEHSEPAERTHLFSAYFATSLIAGVIGSMLGGWIPTGLVALPLGLDHFGAYRATLVLSALLGWSSLIPFSAMGLSREAPIAHDPAARGGHAWSLLGPIGLNAFLIGSGAGLVIPFMNLYFKTRFDCSSAQIGVFFSVAQIVTAAASLLGPLIARRLGKLRTATISELLSLPFLVTLGLEHRLEVAVAAFWMRATLMQAATPLNSAFIMEALPPALRARATSLSNLVWNVGWATSAAMAGALIARFGYDVPFYVTAGLYLVAAVTFYLRFRRVKEPARASVSEALVESP